MIFEILCILDIFSALSFSVIPGSNVAFNFVICLIIKYVYTVLLTGNPFDIIGLIDVGSVIVFFLGLNGSIFGLLYMLLFLKGLSFLIN